MYYLENNLIVNILVQYLYACVPGGHILSGAVLETKALDELFPDWKEKGVHFVGNVLNHTQHSFVIKIMQFIVNIFDFDKGCM